MLPVVRRCGGTPERGNVMSGTTNVSFAPLSDTKEADWELGQVLSAYMLCATLWLLFSTAIGVLLALKFIYPDMGSIPALSFGRLRQIHTNDTFYGWASPALVGLALYIAARSSGTRLYSVRLAWIALFLFNLAAIAGTVAVDLGASYGNQEYREWLWWIRIILALAMIATAWNLVATVARRESDDIYLSNWYTMAAVLWVIVITLVALLPWYQYGLGQVAVAGFFMHNAVGMWFTPLVLGVAYYALPKTLNRPIYSYSLGI